jgi:hypothetical protein
MDLVAKEALHMEQLWSSNQKILAQQQVGTIDLWTQMQ